MASPAGEDKSDQKRLFINSLDSYEGRNLGKFLSQCVVGALLEEAEEEEEDNESVASGGAGVTLPKEGCYEIIGTLKDPDKPKPDFATKVISYETRDQLYSQLEECDIIVYDITEDPDQIDEAVFVISELNAHLETLEKSKIFILITSVMTWAKSKPLDPDDHEIPFTEDDYRRRKPHPNFKDHIAAEKTVIKMGKTNKAKLTTYVVASGLTYGCGEHIFHYMYKAAWHNAPQLQCFGQGNNVVPSIHIKDLSSVIQNIADTRPKTRYLVAVDDSKNTLEEIVRAVSASLGTGKIRIITKEEALLSKEIEQANFDMLLVDLRMDAVHVKESMRIKWTSETGIVENIAKIVKEYKETRHLLPMRAFITGPPASGKTTVAAQLCDHYKLHHIKIKDVIDEAIERLTRSAARADQDDEGEEDARTAEDQETLDAITENKEANGNGRIDDMYIKSFFREKLKSMPCQNQGFVLDSYPKTLEQARDLFAGDPEEADEAGESSAHDRTIMPEVVVCFEADDDFLRARIMDLPESVVAGTHNTEDGLKTRLHDYRTSNTEDDSVLTFFDEVEIHPERVDVTKDESPNMLYTVELIKKLMGEPRNYGPTPEELEEITRCAEEVRLRRETEERAERERREADEAEQRKRRQQDWTARLEEVKREEFEHLETQSIPLRNYLVKAVMPTLTQALIDCCRVRPDDAIDYLAEYLFQHNPQVD